MCYFLELTENVGLKVASYMTAVWQPHAPHSENKYFVADWVKRRKGCLDAVLFRPKLCSFTWILHSASTSCSLVWASSSSISLSWFFKLSFSSSVSSVPPAGAVVTATRTRPSLLKRLLHFSQPSTLDFKRVTQKIKKVRAPKKKKKKKGFQGQ